MMWLKAPSKFSAEPASTRYGEVKPVMKLAGLVLKSNIMNEHLLFSAKLPEM
jgi:hypothetical protein